MAIKLIALDLDGTLTNSRKEVTAHTKDVLRQAAAKGAVVVLASGRPMLGIAPIADFLELDKVGGIVMAYNGGHIVDWKTKEVINLVTFNHEYIPEALTFSRRYNIPILTYSETEILTEGPLTRWSHREETNCGKPITLVDDLVSYVDFPIVKMMFAGDPEELKVPEREVAAYFDGRLDVYRAEPHFLELMPKGINKAAGIAMIADYLGVKPDEVMACGDANNDIPMLEYAGLGVAVANAGDAAKAAAQFVSKSNDEDGVAYAVEKFVLNA